MKLLVGIILSETVFYTASEDMIQLIPQGEKYSPCESEIVTLLSGAGSLQSTDMWSECGAVARRLGD